MTVWNISYTNKKIEDEIRLVTGKPHGFIRNLRMGGTGSPPLGLVFGPEKMMQVVTRDNARKYCNIQLRTEGLLIRLNYLTNVWATALSYREIIGVHLTPNVASENRFDAWLITLKLLTPQQLVFSVSPEFKRASVVFFGKAHLPVVQHLQRG